LNFAEQAQPCHEKKHDGLLLRVHRPRRLAVLQTKMMTLP